MRILWATEGSANSTQAGGAIPHLRGGSESEILTLAVIPDDPMPWLDLDEKDTALPHLERQRREALHRVLDAALTKHGLHQGHATIRVEVGDPARTIARVAREEQSDVIVAATRHETIATEIVGPTTLELMVQAPCPVLVTRTSQPWRSVVLATDGSDEAAPAEAAVRQLAPEGAAITTLTVVPPPPSNAEPDEAAEHAATGLAAAAAERMREAGARADYAVRTGRPARAIVELAREVEADVIAMGSHGRTGWRRAMMGSVAQEVARTARSSVLIAPSRVE
jgi:nucleotide-binding universal stress UspA family protein